MSLSPPGTPEPCQVAAVRHRWVHAHPPLPGEVAVAGAGAVVALGPTGFRCVEAAAPTLLTARRNGAAVIAVYAGPWCLPTVTGRFDHVELAPVQPGCTYISPHFRPNPGEQLTVYTARHRDGVALFLVCGIRGVIVCGACGAGFADHRGWAAHTGITIPAHAFRANGKPLGRLAAPLPIDPASRRVTPAQLLAAARHGLAAAATA